MHVFAMDVNVVAFSPSSAKAAHTATRRWLVPPDLCDTLISAKQLAKYVRSPLSSNTVT